MVRRKTSQEIDSAPVAPVLTVHDVAEAVKTQLGDLWLPQLYLKQVKSKRTRAMKLQIMARVNQTEILHTLLGIELRVGLRRIACPDLATARYLAVFARVGCNEIALPYDITQISRLADELESAWQRMLLLIGEAASGRATGFQTRVRTVLAQEIRTALENIGAGPAIPAFNQNTKQRPSR